MIPEKMQDFARELTALAKKYNLLSISGQYIPGFDDRNALGFHDTISYWWQSGRHYAETNRIKLQFQHTVQIAIEEEKAAAVLPPTTQGQNAGPLDSGSGASPVA